MPWVNWLLIALNVLIFFMTGSTDPSGHSHGFLLDKQVFALDPSAPKLWQYFTYQFMHEDWMHIGGNMLFLYIFGNNINDRLGHLGYLAFYLAGGVVSGMGHSAFATQPIIGASGSIMAVTGAYLALMPQSNISIFYFFIFYVGKAEIPALWFIAFTFGQDILAATGIMGGGESVAHLAHISGAMFGALLCLGLLSVGLLPRDRFDILSMISRWNRRRQYRVLVNQGYNPFEFSMPPTMQKPSISAGPIPPDPTFPLRAQISEAHNIHDFAQAARLYQELRKLDPTAFLPRQVQLDVANQLASEQLYTEAAQAYEIFLSRYGNYEHIEQVELMLGVIYARYVPNYPRARQLLTSALGHLHTDREIEWTRNELSQIPMTIAPPIA
jgi:membrane associated rhomboid family serine protease